MKKILFFTYASSGGGAERVMTHLANSFAERGFSCTYLSLIENGYYDLDERVKRETVKVSSGKRRVFSELKAIRRYIRKNSFDKVIVFGYPVSIKIALATVGMSMKGKLIMSERNDPNSNIRSRAKRRLRNWAYTRADRVVFQTEEAMNFFPRAVRKRGIIIPNPLVKRIVCEKSDTEPNRLIAAGRIDEQKNFSLLIRAFSIFHKSHPQYRLDIYGSPEKTEEVGKLTALISALDLASSVRLCGFSKEIQREMAASSLYVSSSDYEGISNSMIEAMAVGLPVVCTDCPCGGARMMIEDHVNGILVPVGKAEPLAAALSEVADHPEFALKMGRNAKKIAETLSVDVIFEKWAALC